MNHTLTLIVCVSIFVIGLLSIAVIRATLFQSNWSLGEALSDEATVSAGSTDAVGQFVPQLTATGVVIEIKVLRPSSSRLIALMGLIAILLMYFGVGILTLYKFGTTGEVPKGLNDALWYLASGMTMFVPYAANKFSSMFDSLMPKK